MTEDSKPFAPEDRSTQVPIDWHLLQGFSFRCRPDCALCCFASPSVTREEGLGLLQIRPDARFLTDAAGIPTNIAARKDGGACGCLHQRRCGVYSVRPFPCREFPLSVHVGSRLQATLVLACPGVSLEPLRRWGEGEVPPMPPVGLEEEIERTLREARGKPLTAWLAEGARIERRLRDRWSREGRWREPEAIRADLLARLPLPEGEDFPVGDPPERTEGWDALPFFFDESQGLVTYLSRAEGWEAFQMREEGGPTGSLGLLPRLEAPPELTGEAQRMLRGYLAYNLSRDFLFWLAYRELEHQRDWSLEEVVTGLLRELAVQAVARGAFRAALKGESPTRLNERTIEAGIRAIDNDFLDQVTLGGIL